MSFCWKEYGKQQWLKMRLLVKRQHCQANKGNWKLENATCLFWKQFFLYFHWFQTVLHACSFYKIYLFVVGGWHAAKGQQVEIKLGPLQGGHSFYTLDIHFTNWDTRVTHKPIFLCMWVCTKMLIHNKWFTWFTKKQKVWFCLPKVWQAELGKTL